MGKYLNQYQPAYPEPPGWDEWDVAGNAYREFGYNLGSRGRADAVHYGNAPQDYLTNVIAGAGGHSFADAVADREPFLLNLSTFAPHAP